MLAWLILVLFGHGHFLCEGCHAADGAMTSAHSVASATGCGDHEQQPHDHDRNATLAELARVESATLTKLEHLDGLGGDPDEHHCALCDQQPIPIDASAGQVRDSRIVGDPGALIATARHSVLSTSWRRCGARPPPGQELDWPTERVGKRRSSVLQL